MPASAGRLGAGHGEAASEPGSDEAARLRSTWPAIRDQLFAGTYRPMPIRRVTIPKPGSDERELGIPTVTDRLIQQALL